MVMKAKTFLLLLVISIFTLPCAIFAQSAVSHLPDTSKMTTYFLVLLKTGQNRTQDSLSAARIQDGHMAHIKQMSLDKKLVLAGPFIDNTALRGIFVLHVDSIEEATSLTQQDPAVSSGRLVAEIHPWYGPVELQNFEWY